MRQSTSINNFLYSKGFNQTAYSQSKAFNTFEELSRNKELMKKQSLFDKKNKTSTNNVDYYLMFSRALMQNEDLIPNSQECIEEIGKINVNLYVFEETAYKSQPEKINLSVNPNTEKSLINEIVAQKVKNEEIVGSINSKSLQENQSNQLNAKEHLKHLNSLKQNQKGKKKNITDKTVKQKETIAEESEETIKLKAINAKKIKRRKVLNFVLSYLESNCLLVSQYLNNNPFQSKPFQLPYSTEYMKAIKFGEIEAVRSAIQMNPNFLFSYDHFNQTGFHWAAKLGNFDVLVVLLSCGSNCNMYDHHNRTPLYLAAMNNHEKCCKLLLENYGNPFLADNEGKKPIDVTTDPAINTMLARNMDGVYKNQMIRDKLFAMFKFIEDKKLKRAFDIKSLKGKTMNAINTQNNNELQKEKKE